MRGARLPQEYQVGPSAVAIDMEIRPNSGRQTGDDQMLLHGTFENGRFTVTHVSIAQYDPVNDVVGWSQPHQLQRPMTLAAENGLIQRSDGFTRAQLQMVMDQIPGASRPQRSVPEGINPNAALPSVAPAFGRMP
jgi:hypothetical protein